MGRILRQNAAVDTITRHVRLTLANAAGKGSPYKEDAERFLSVLAAHAVTLANRLQANLTLYEVALAHQRAQNLRADDTIAGGKDQLYQAGGRRARDRAFSLIYWDGSDTYRDFSAAEKPMALEMNALALELHPLPRIPPDLVKEVVAELRAEAKVLAQVNAELVPHQTEQRFLLMQFQMNARRSQTELSHLKQYWKSQGETEHDIHLMIPNAKKPTTPAVGVAPTPAELIESTLGALPLFEDGAPAAPSTGS